MAGTYRPVLAFSGQSMLGRKGGIYHPVHTSRTAWEHSSSSSQRLFGSDRGQESTGREPAICIRSLRASRHNRLMNWQPRGDCHRHGPAPPRGSRIRRTASKRAGTPKPNRRVAPCQPEARRQAAPRDRADVSVKQRAHSSECSCCHRTFRSEHPSSLRFARRD